MISVIEQYLTSVAHKNQIFYSIRQHVRLQNFTNMYTRVYTHTAEKNTVLQGKIITIFKGIPVAGDKL